MVLYSTHIHHIVYVAYTNYLRTPHRFSPTLGDHYYRTRDVGSACLVCAKNSSLIKCNGIIITKSNCDFDEYDDTPGAAHMVPWLATNTKVRILCIIIWRASHW